MDLICIVLVLKTKFLPNPKVACRLRTQGCPSTKKNKIIIIKKNVTDQFERHINTWDIFESNPIRILSQKPGSVLKYFQIYQYRVTSIRAVLYVGPFRFIEIHPSFPEKKSVISTSPTLSPKSYLFLYMHTMAILSLSSINCFQFITTIEMCWVNKFLICFQRFHVKRCIFFFLIFIQGVLEGPVWTTTHLLSPDSGFVP